MNIRKNKKSIIFTDVMNEGLLDVIMGCCSVANCRHEITEFSTKVRVTGTITQLNDFIISYNT